MDVDAAADELYGLEPERFTARRTELANAARAAGDADARKAIGQFRRPTTAAWVVNLVTRTHPADVEELLALGGRLRDAQRELAGDQLRELSAERRRAVAALAELGRSEAVEAGHRVGDDTVREVQATFDAALVDEQAGAAVRSGRLTAALSYSGFGEVDLTDAVADVGTGRPRLTVVPPPDVKPSRRSTGRQAKDHDARREAAADARAKRVAEAQAAADERERQAREVGDELDTAAGRRDELARRAQELEEKLHALQRDLRAAETALRSARSRADAARRASDRASDRLEEARREAD